MASNTLTASDKRDAECHAETALVPNRASEFTLLQVNTILQ